MQPGERMICEIKRHPIGLFIIYAACLIAVGASAVLAFGLAPSIDSSGDGSSVGTLGLIVLAVVTVISSLYSLVATIVYWGNKWIITSDSITQVAQTGLFHTNASQLSLGNLEDITVEQNGLLTHIFNYGVLRAETAGERSKFMFIYCPDPNHYAQQVLAAREVFEQGKQYAANSEEPTPEKDYSEPR
jgi:uncharacterized membrane protein YdbT with pleckstrin-like domain